MNFRELLVTLDNPKKKEGDDDVISAIGKMLLVEQKSLPEARSEIMALRFQDNTRHNVWNTYYGPIATGVENVIGKPVYSLDILRPSRKTMLTG